MNRRELLGALAATTTGLATGIGVRAARASVYPAAGAAAAAPTLVVHSTTDTQVFAPVIRDFQAQNPGLAIRYEELDAGELYERFLADLGAGRPVADLLLSSAMDLQVKLVNDGHAASHRSDNAAALPAWARWRDEAFGFTFEPAVMVFNRVAMGARPLPRSRAELLQALLREPGFYRGRIGSYDIARSRVGYLLASQDARLSSEFGGLLEAFGALAPRTAVRSADLLDRLASGELVLAYNLLGSYAVARLEAGAPLAIVYPDDYTLAVARTAVIPARAAQADGAHRFLEYLLSLPGQRTLAARGRLPAVRPELAGSAGLVTVGDARIGLPRPIALGPGLLVYLDRQKRQRLLATWDAALQARGGSAVGASGTSRTAQGGG